MKDLLEKIDEKFNNEVIEEVSGEEHIEIASSYDSSKNNLIKKNF